MLIAKTKKELREILSKQEKKKIGFVPTMGALHSGHLSLIEKANDENDFTIVSVFVNPKQFNNQEDLEKYPEDLNGDIEKIETIADCLFCPSTEDIYPSDYQEKYFELEQFEEVMEGKHRGGHFQGVCNIVYLLFELIHPTHAYFGIKDYQQLAIIQHISKKHFSKIKIVACEIVREKNGLAKSSRNQNLSKDQFQKASFIYQSLLKAKKLAGNNLSTNDISSIIESDFKQNHFELEYFEISDHITLLPLSKPTVKSRAFIAAYLGKVRLIDNMELIE